MTPRRRKAPWYKRISKSLAAGACCLVVLVVLSVVAPKVMDEALGVIAVTAATTLATYLAPKNKETES